MGERVGIGRAQRVDLAGDDPEVRAQELQERGVHETGLAVSEVGEERGHVRRQERGGGVVHRVAEAGDGVQVQKAARPEPQLLGVDVAGVLGVGPQKSASLSRPPETTPCGASRRSTSSTTPFFAEIVAQPEPATGQPRPVQERASPGRRNVHGLRVRDARDREREQHEDDRADTATATALTHARGPPS